MPYQCPTAASRALSQQSMQEWVEPCLHQGVDLLEQMVEERIPLCLELRVFWVRLLHFGQCADLPICSHHGPRYDRSFFDTVLRQHHAQS